MRTDDLPLTITVEKAGELLGIGRRTAYRAAATGELPTVRIGRRLLVPTARLLRLLGADDVSATMRSPSEAVVPERA